MAEEELTVPSNEECQNLLKYARHVALVEDLKCKTLLKFSARLEELNIIPKERETKKIRNKHLKKHQNSVSVSDDKIEEMVQKVQSHPDAIEIVSTLFRDLNPRRVKNAISKLSNKEDKKENNSE